MLLQIRAGIRAGNVGYFRRAAAGDDLPASNAALWPHVDHPIGGGYKFDMMLDDDHRIALVNQAL